MNRNELRKADINLMVVFETLMLERNVTRAAEKLFLGQPLDIVTCQNPGTSAPCINPEIPWLLGLDAQVQAPCAGQGQGGRIGMGFGPLLVYGELQQSEMESEGGDAADAYTLTQRELGARLYLLGKGSRIRPFAQYAYGFRRLESVETTVQGEGIATTPGAGVALYLMKRLSIEGSWARTTGDVDRARASSDDDWSDLPEESDRMVYVIQHSSFRTHRLCNVRVCASVALAGLAAVEPTFLDERQRFIAVLGGPLRGDLRPPRPVLRGEVYEERRVRRVRRPGGCRRELPLCLW